MERERVREGGRQRATEAGCGRARPPRPPSTSLVGCALPRRLEDARALQASPPSPHRRLQHPATASQEGPCAASFGRGERAEGKIVVVGGREGSPTTMISLLFSVFKAPPRKKNVTFFLFFFSNSLSLPLTSQSSMEDCNALFETFVALFASEGTREKKTPERKCCKTQTRNQKEKKLPLCLSQNPFPHSFSWFLLRSSFAQ